MHSLATWGAEPRVGLLLAGGSGFPKTDSADDAGSSPASSNTLGWPSIQATGCNPVHGGETPSLNSNGKRPAWTRTPSRKRLAREGSRVRFPCFPPLLEQDFIVEKFDMGNLERLESESRLAKGARLQNVWLRVRILPGSPMASCTITSHVSRKDVVALIVMLRRLNGRSVCCCKWSQNLLGWNGVAPCSRLEQSQPEG